MPVVKFTQYYRGRLTQEAVMSPGDTMEVSPGTASLLLQRGVVTMATVSSTTEGNRGFSVIPTPETFKVVGIMRVYNEEDILPHTIEHALNQGLELHIFDNHSTDKSFAIARKYRSRGCVVERWGDRNSFSHEKWGNFLDEYVPTLECDWVTILSADEILLPPWRGVSYRDALYYVDNLGFNCVNHAYVDFWATKEGYTVAEDPQIFFTHFEVRAFPLERSYKKVSNVKHTGGGHEVFFEGKHVFDKLFILKNYRFRSEQQFKEKIAARNARMAEDIEAGVCCEYYGNPPDTYLRSPDTLKEWSDDFWLEDFNS